MRNNKPVIIFTCFVAIAILLYFYLKKKKNAVSLEDLPTTVVPVPTVTTAERQVIQSSKGLSKLTDAQVKKYATWIDRIEQIFAEYRKSTGEKYAKPTAEAVANAQALGLLGYDDLVAVVNFWQSVRKRKVLSALSMFSDTTDKISGLVTKLKNFKIIP